MSAKEGSVASNASKTVVPILLAISFSHLLNDTIQSLVPAIYPLVRESFSLSFGQVGIITFVFQMASSLLQPLVGIYTDRSPSPYALPIGMGFSLVGLVLLSIANSFYLVLVSVAVIGIGSSVFHPEASRMAHAAAGGKRGLAQSVFQVGGNAGSSLGPLLAALVVAPFGRFNVIWFSFMALLAIVVLYQVSSWYKPKALRAHVARKFKTVHEQVQTVSRPAVIRSVVILLVLIFSKYFYLASLTSYYTFYLIDKFHVSVQSSQVYLFIFLFAVAAGTIIGGPVGDRFGRKYVIWASILGAAPFTMALPYANLFWTAVLSVFIGMIIASAFSAILVYAQELLPGNVGTVSGLFFGFAFGMGGVGSALLGRLADGHGIAYVYQLCAYLPLIGVIAALLPNLDKKRTAATN